jgi:putative membrane protein
MISAFTVSTLFLVSYLTYHFNMQTTRFGGEGLVRMIYFTVLFTHMPLAATVPPMAVMAIRRAMKGEFERHRRLTRWLLPIWLYVSVTGVVIYLMLRPYYPG